MIDRIDLRAIKEMLIKLDELEGKEKREYRELLINFIKENFEKSCNKYIAEVKINRDGCYGFTLYTFDKYTDKDEYIKITYITHNGSCEIVFDGKFEISLKY